MGGVECWWEGWSVEWEGWSAKWEGGVLSGRVERVCFCV